MEQIMELLRIRLEKLFKEAVRNIRPDFEDWGKLVLQPATDEKFGDYQTNFAMTASKIFRLAPKMIAENLIVAEVCDSSQAEQEDQSEREKVFCSGTLFKP